MTTTFENGVISHTHLVTYPSVWLPPSPSLRLCLVGYDVKLFDQLSQHCHNNWPNQNIAFYMLDRECDCESLDQARLDWLLINGDHCDAVISSARTWSTAAITTSIACKLKFWHLSEHSIISSLVRREPHIVTQVEFAIDQAIIIHQRRTSQ